LLPLAIYAQTATMPITLGRASVLAPPAAGGSDVVFGSSLAPDGTVLPAVDLWVAPAGGSTVRRLTRFEGGVTAGLGVNSVAAASDGSRAVFSAIKALGREEEVHLVEVATGTGRVVSVYAEGCIQPMCVNCFFACVHTPHVTPDGSVVLYAVSAERPFFTVRDDGSGLARLPVYSGALAPSPQRVISRNGLVVFSSAAPFGPTLVAAPVDVYVMSLDGKDIRAVTRLGTDSALYARNATISEDGAAIAFESNRDPESGGAGKIAHVYVARTDGTGLLAIAPGASPSISADG
jgi:hypothetical protein